MSDTVPAKSSLIEVSDRHVESVLEDLCKKPTDDTLIQFFRYSFVGGGAFVIDFGLLTILTELVGPDFYLKAAAIGFLAGLVTNYILSVLWVFQQRSVQSKWLEFALFALIGIIGLGFNQLFMWFFTEQVHTHYLSSKIFATGFVYLWNFSARKLVLFS